MTSADRSRRRRGVTRPWKAALALVALLASCAEDNAILELDVVLPVPTDETTQRFAFVQVRTDELGFDIPWSGGDSLEGFRLSNGTPEERTQQISVVAQPSHYERDIHVRVHFCRESQCTGIGDDVAPEARLVVEHPFYSGQRTFAEWTIDEVPGAAGEPDRVERCAIAAPGCREGMTTNFCRMDGTHFCE